MTEVRGSGRKRRRRVEAEHSIHAILEAAGAVLNERPGASIGDIAEVAGVTRQTVYAHYPSRDALLNAAIDHLSTQAVAAMDAAETDDLPPTEALLRLATIGWRTYERYPRLLGMAPIGPDAERERHHPVRQRFEHVIRRGQDAGDIDQTLPASWLATVAMTLGHAAAEDVTAGRLPAEAATATIEYSLLRITGGDDAYRRGEAEVTPTKPPKR